jgi:hypothetical protein
MAFIGVNEVRLVIVLANERIASFVVKVNG